MDHASVAQGLKPDLKKMRVGTTEVVP